MQKYAKIYVLTIIHTCKNYKNLIGLSIFLLTCLIIFAHIWKFAAAKVGSLHLESDQLLWYIGFNEWVLVALPSVHEDMEYEFRSGRLAYLLPRPISYIASIFCEGLGVLCANLCVLGIVTFSFIYFQVGSLPFSTGAFLIALLLGLCAGVVGLIFHMLIGLSAFWVQQVEPFHWMWEKSLFTLGGLMLPLAVYPSWLQMIAYATPFPSVLGQRSALALHFSMENVFSILTNLILWGLIALSGVLFFYRRGLKIVNIEGG